MTKSNPDPLYFRSPRAFSNWLKKNHNKKSEIWILMYKKGYTPVSARTPLTAATAWDVGLCHGWIEMLTRRIDHATYKLKFVKRKKGSTWSGKKIKRYKELKKQGDVLPSGVWAYEHRDKSKSENRPPRFSPAQEKEFQSHAAAWDFFLSQNPSYQKEMKRWVTSAKRPETQAKRLHELIQDSGEGTKLKRVLAAIERIQPKYPKGKTPIEAAKNIGPTIGAELRASGIETVEVLQSLGWEEAFVKLCELHPHRLNLNMLYALTGAVENQNWKLLDPELRSEAKSYLRQVRRDWADF